MIGKTLGQYRILEQVGQGGMARVYKAYDPQLDRHVAIKVLPDINGQDPRRIARFEQEARIIARLDHPHILPTYGFGEQDGLMYLVLRYVASGTLLERIAGEGPLPLERASHLLTQVAAALDHAHRMQILHRDVKSSNVMIDEKWDAYLMDFGVGKMLEGAVDLTSTGGLLGTPAYMAPEQCVSTTRITPASDQYSLGIILYEMVTGRTPYQAETPLAIIRMQLKNEPMPLPVTLRPDLPDEAQRVLLKVLSHEPGGRYPTCSDLARAFEQSIRQGISQPAAPQEKKRDPDMTFDDDRPLFTGQARSVLDASAGRGSPAPNPWLSAAPSGSNQPSNQLSSNQENVSMMKKNIGSLIGGVGGFLLFISSFMPWLDVDVILARGQYSAWEIIRLAETFGFNNLSFLYLIPILGLGACGLALWNILQPTDAAGSKNRAIGSLAAGGVALLALLFFAGGVANANAQVSDISSGLVNKLIRAGFGTTLAWLSTVAIGVGALMNMGIIDVGSGDSLPSRPAAPRPVMPQPVRPPALSPSSFMPPPAVAINSAGPSLFALSGPNAGQTFTLRDKQVIGRSSQCEIQLKDMTVSRKHAMLREASGGWFIQDQESTGGILVNGQKVPAVQLKSGDRIQIGESVLQFRS